ncbi:MAG: 50S ribosomal protein L16 [Leptospiraceae bacterium]|nr:50S ribosomal protein L16 [Leptospiraceae bacterium]MDW7975178.1 50S ribosomal protein L16 [Leptospiraceae bacterium]
MLSPKKVKYRKRQKGRLKGKSTRANKVSFGEFGLKAITAARITARQIEAARRVISRHIKRGGKLWIRIFPDYPVTKKPAETRMGSGKGNPEYWVAIVKPGRVMFEISGIPEDVVREAFRLASHKLPVKTTIVKKEII